jgi:hypothetical protein
VETCGLDSSLVTGRTATLGGSHVASYQATSVSAPWVLSHLRGAFLLWAPRQISVNVEARLRTNSTSTSPTLNLGCNFDTPAQSDFH